MSLKYECHTTRGGSILRQVVIVDYGVGNIRSVENAFKSLGFDNIVVSKKENDIQNAACLVLPGVGAFADAMNALRKDQLVGLLEEQVLNRKKPLLSICVGMQLLFDSSEEGHAQGLGWIPGQVVKFQVPPELTVPHFGWNDIQIKKEEWLFANMGAEKNFYFAHSYHAKTDFKYVVATCDYGSEIPIVVKRDNILGIQFHPEKSHNGGRTLLKNYVNSIFK